VRKLVRYSLVSLISIAISQSVLMVTFGMLRWTASLSNIVACAVATAPSYYLNRTWTWGRQGTSRLWSEVVPFWAIAFLGLAFSTWAADFGSTLARQAAVSHQAATMIVMASALLAFGVLWIGKFAIFNAMLFAERPRHLREPTRRRARRDLAGAGRPIGVLVVAATAGLLLLGSAGSPTATAQGAQVDTTGPPTSEPATTAPPTTEPATTQPATTEPATTAPPTSEPSTTQPTTPPSTTAVVGSGGATAPPVSSRATSASLPSSGGTTAQEPVGSEPGGPAGEASSGAVTGLSEPQQVRPPRRPEPPGSSPRAVLGKLLRGGPAQLPTNVAREVTTALQRLSTAELGILLLFAVFSLVLTVIGGTTLWWMVHAWRTPESLDETGFVGPADEPQLSFSLIVPARQEQAVLGSTLARLAASDHPAFEILVVVGHDDPATAAVAERAARRHPGLIRVLVDTNRRKNKPKALNTALPYCRGDVVGVFDAEDEVHPQLLRHVDARFTATRAEVVQGGVQLMNYHSNWYSVRNVLEYYFWFRSRLHFHARKRFIPLGGNTVFVRTDVLRRVGGWDPECLAEDCELGIRLSSLGATVAVAYDPLLVTREETPATLRALLKQRTRWNQGFLQVLRKGEWRRLPTRRQRLLARYTLAMPFLQAFIGLLIPMSLAATIFAKAPTLAALMSFVPLVPVLAVLAMEAVGLGEFCRNYGFRARLRDYLRLVLGTLPYHTLLAFAATRAVARELRGNRTWEKTAHVGAHRAQPAAAVAAERWAEATDRTA
jgi:cellulose synthase/poly-beta-1,6-N-acetylglucosamine synthase-like glycosyltransferase/putative flippase GtrA